MKIVSLAAVREARKIQQGDPEYEKRILEMDKLALLEEMMCFQEERSQVENLTLSLMIRGRILFRRLELCAETRELRNLSRAYRRHLLYELDAYLKSCREGKPLMVDSK